MWLATVTTLRNFLTRAIIAQEGGEARREVSRRCSFRRLKLIEQADLFLCTAHFQSFKPRFPFNVFAYILDLLENGGDRLRQGFGRPTDAMPGYSMQLVKKRREKTIANSNELALAA
jgi:hypothetical protein